MATNGNMAVRFDEKDKEALRQVAAYLQRTQADALRVLVRGAAIALKEKDSKAAGKKSGKQPAR